MNNKQFYTCKYERTFKEVFLNPNNKDLLKALLESILKVKIDDIKLNKTELLSGNNKVKDKRVDAIVKTGNKIINIEINSNNNNYFHARNASYAFNIYQTHYLLGKKYTQDEEIIQINITWGLGVNKKKFKTYMVCDIEDSKDKYINNFKILEVNMDYHMRIWYDNINEEIKKNKYLIMLGLNDKELKKMPNDEIINKFKKSIENVNKDPEFIEYMTEEEDRLKKQNTLVEQGITQGFEQGIEQGIEQGFEQGIIKTATNMLNKNMNLNDIAEITGLSIEQIKSLRK